MDFDKIFLSDMDTRIILAVDTAAVVRLHPADAGHLISLGFIAPYALSERTDEYVITSDGSRYCEYYREKQAERKRSEEFARFSRKVSLASLSVAICSFLLSLYAIFFK